jgi:hypothetical protein
MKIPFTLPLSQREREFSGELAEFNGLCSYKINSGW